MRPITNNISVCLRQGIGNGGNQDSDQWQNKTRSDYATVKQHLHDRRRKTRLGIHWDITSIIFNTRNGDEMFFCRCLHHDKSFSCSISCSLFNRRVRCLILSCFQCIWFLVCPLAVWEQMSNFSSVSYLLHRLWTVTFIFLVSGVLFRLSGSFVLVWYFECYQCFPSFRPRILKPAILLL